MGRACDRGPSGQGDFLQVLSARVQVVHPHKSLGGHRQTEPIAIDQIFDRGKLVCLSLRVDIFFKQVSVLCAEPVQ